MTIDLFQLSYLKWRCLHVEDETIVVVGVPAVDPLHVHGGVFVVTRLVGVSREQHGLDIINQDKIFFANFQLLGKGKHFVFRN